MKRIHIRAPFHDSAIGVGRRSRGSSRTEETCLGCVLCILLVPCRAPYVPHLPLETSSFRFGNCRRDPYNAVSSARSSSNRPYVFSARCSTSLPVLLVCGFCGTPCKQEDGSLHYCLVTRESLSHTDNAQHAVCTLTPRPCVSRILWHQHAV